MPGRFLIPVNQVHRFVRVADTGSINIANGAASAGATINTASGGLTLLSTSAAGGPNYFALAMAFQLADTPGASELTSLYDQYRLHHVEVEIVPFWNQAPSTVAGNGNLSAVMHSVLDWDDATAPAASTSGINTLQQYRTYKCQNLFSQEKFKWAVVARPALAAYAGAFTSYTSVAPMWIDCNSANVQHYGVKWIWEVIDPAAVASFIDLRFSVRYYLEMRMTR